MLGVYFLWVTPKYNAANNGRLVFVNFVQQWRSHAQKAQAQGCPESAANDVAWPCYVLS